MRKIFGNRSAKGELAIARLPTIGQTCSKQGHTVLAYLSAAILSLRRRQPAPSLLSR